MTETTLANWLGYARVSTYGQTLDAQLEQLRDDGCRTIYRKKASEVRTARRELVNMLRRIKAGGVVTVTRIDRLAGSTFDLLAIVKQFTDFRGQFRSLAVLDGLADVERDLIRTRTVESRSRAKARAKIWDDPLPHAAAAGRGAAAAG